MLYELLLTTDRIQSPESLATINEIDKNAHVLRLDWFRKLQTTVWTPYTSINGTDESTIVQVNTDPFSMEKRGNGETSVIKSDVYPPAFACAREWNLDSSSCFASSSSFLERVDGGVSAFILLLLLHSVHYSLWLFGCPPMSFLCTFHPGYHYQYCR